MGRCIFAIALASSLVGGCTDPSYADPADADVPPVSVEGDAQAPRGEGRAEAGAAPPEADAGAPREAAGNCPPGACDRDAGGWVGAPDATVPGDPSLALKPGRYAILSRFYGEDGANGVGWFAEEQTVLGTVERTALGALSLDWQVCRSYTDIRSLAVRVEADLLFPQYTPVRRLELIVTGSSFRTQGEPLQLGYEPVSEADCPPGTRIAKSGRRWLTDGRCTCPSSDLPPTKRDDCRVIDSDMDFYPGATVRYSSGSDSYMAIRDRSQLVDGVIDPAGFHHASYLRLGESNALQCTSGCSGPPNVSLCPQKGNPVVFQPLAELAPDGNPWTCATLQAYIVSHPFELGMPQKPDC